MTRQQKYPDTAYFHYHNENPKGRYTGDCVVRAIATATGKTWDEVLQGLTEIALKHKEMVNSKECYDKYLQTLGWEKMRQPRKGNNKKYTGSEFCKMLNGGALFAENLGLRNHDTSRIVAHIGGGHVVAIIDRRVWDTWDSTDGTIGNYWIKHK